MPIFRGPRHNDLRNMYGFRLLYFRIICYMETDHSYTLVVTTHGVKSRNFHWTTKNNLFDFKCHLFSEYHIFTFERVTSCLNHHFAVASWYFVK